jgi:glycosyltransferase involved in cell wall biosynthesis
MDPAISIVTPSFRQTDLLRLCSRSVLDQAGVEVEHIIQEGGGPEALGDWRPEDVRLKLATEPDRGMYDAINRGLRKARGLIIGHLNCDEQYLPGALLRVHHFFEVHPEIEVVFGDAVLIDLDGRPLSYRRILPPKWNHTRHAHLGTLTCSTFFRRSLLERGFFYPDHYRAIGDAALVLRWIKAGVAMAALRVPLAAFTFTGQNLGASAAAAGEKAILEQEFGTDLARLRPYFILQHRFRKFIAGAYWPRRLTVAVYSKRSPECREIRVLSGWRHRWPAELAGTA